MKSKGEHIFHLFWVAFFLLIISRSMTFNPKARLIPLLVAGVCLFMSVCVLIGGFLKRERTGALSGEDELLRGIMKKVEVSTDEEEGAKKKEKLSPEEKRSRFFGAVGWILGFVLMIYVFGFLISIPIFTVLFMRVKRESWVLSLSCSAGLLLGVYVAFVKLSQSTLHEGLLFRLLGD